MPATLRPLAAAMIAAGALLCASAPAMAADDAVIVDGVKRSPAELAKWKGELHVVAGRRGKPSLGFTRKAEFKAYVRKHGGAKKRPTAKASWHGDYVDLYTERDARGPGFRINSGEGMYDLGRVCAWWFHFCSDHNDNVSSVQTNWVGITLYSETWYNRYAPEVGRSLYVGPGQGYNIPWWFDNVASSAIANWNRG
jgi:hypothetical protein